MIIKTKTSKEDFYYFLLLVVAMVFSAFLFLRADSNTPDYITYSTFYYRSFDVPLFSYLIEPLYILAMRLSLLLSLPYNTFFMLCGEVSLVLIWRVIRQLSNNYISVFVAFLFFPFSIDYIQIRNFIGYVIVFCGMKYLIRAMENGEDKKRNIIKYIVFVLIASGFHLLVLAYIVLAFIPIIKKNTTKLITIICSIIMFALFSFSNVVQRILLNTDKYRVYLSDGDLNRMDLYHSVMMFLLISAFVILAVLVINYRKSFNAYEHLILSLNCYVYLYWVLMIFLGNNFYRLFRNLIPLYYAVMFNKNIENGKEKEKTMVIIKTIVYIIPILIFALRKYL